MWMGMTDVTAAAIYLNRFLGLAPVSSIGMYDVHATGDKKLLPEHKLTPASKRQLYEFFAPFNQLLEDFLREKLGFSGGLGYNYRPEQP